MIIVSLVTAFVILPVKMQDSKQAHVLLMVYLCVCVEYAYSSLTLWSFFFLFVCFSFVVVSDGYA